MQVNKKRIIGNRQYQFQFYAIRRGTFGWRWHSPLFSIAKPVKTRLYNLNLGKIAIMLVIRRVRKYRLEYLPH